MNEYKEIFARKLKYYLALNGKKQIDLARDCGFSSTTVSEWYNGAKMPRMDKLEKMAQYFHCTTSDLISEQTDETERLRKKLNLITNGATDKELTAIIKYALSVIGGEIDV